MKVSSKPSYSLTEIKRLVRHGHYSPTLRVAYFIDSHYEETGIDEVVEKVFLNLKEDDFVKLFELKNLPGTMADVYSSSLWAEARKRPLFRAYHI